MATVRQVAAERGHWKQTGFCTGKFFYPWPSQELRSADIAFLRNIGRIYLYDGNDRHESDGETGQGQADAASQAMPDIEMVRAPF
jgi:hypothetical protein